MGYNMFAYCNNNPIIFCDSNGNNLNISRKDCKNDFEYQARLQTESDIGSKVSNGISIPKKTDNNYNDKTNTSCDIFSAIMSSFSFSLGFGVGLNLKADIADGVGAELGFRVTELTIKIEDGRIDFGHESLYGASIGPVGLYGGYYHSQLCPLYNEIGIHDEENCIYATKYDPGCPSYYHEIIGASAYAIIGLNISLGWDESLYNRKVGIE